MWFTKSSICVVHLHGEHRAESQITIFLQGHQGAGNPSPLEFWNLFKDYIEFLSLHNIVCNLVKLFHSLPIALHAQCKMLLDSALKCTTGYFSLRQNIFFCE